MVGVGFGGSYNWVKHTLSSFSTLVVPYFHLNEYTYQQTFSDVNKIFTALKQTKEIPLFQLLHCSEKPFSALEKCIPFDRRGLSKDGQQKLVPQV